MQVSCAPVEYMLYHCDEVKNLHSCCKVLLSGKRSAARIVLPLGSRPLSQGNFPSQ